MTEPGDVHSGVQAALAQKDQIDQLTGEGESTWTILYENWRDEDSR